MTRKITVDENGFVISIEVLSRQEALQPQPGADKKIKNRPTVSKEPESQPHPRKLVLCSVCNVQVRKDRWDKHIAKVHSAVPRVGPRATKRPKKISTKTVGRGKTTESIKEEMRGIDRSLKKLAPGFHRLKIEELQRRRNMLLKMLRGPQQASQRTPTRTRRKGVGNPGIYSENQAEALRQSRSEESNFGGKYLGHMRRESDGSFGSLPLYDDYGEESGPG